MPERQVRFTEQFFDQLDRLLPGERGADGTPSVTDMLLLDLPRVRDRLAADYEGNTLPTDEPDVVSRATATSTDRQELHRAEALILARALLRHAADPRVLEEIAPVDDVARAYAKQFSDPWQAGWSGVKCMIDSCASRPAPADHSAPWRGT